MLLLLTCYALLQAIKCNPKRFARMLALWLFVQFSAGVLGQVAFDVNASAPVRSLYAHSAFARTPNSRLVSLELDVSTLFQPGAEQAVKEIMVQAVCRRDDVVVVDYWPRTELQSDIDGPVQVLQERDQARDGNLQGFGGYPGIGSVSGAWNQSDYQSQSVQFLQRPARELTVAAGTTNRQRGVYFKMRPNSQTTIEGSRKLGVLLSVPENWRADLMDVTVQAAGLEPPHYRKEGVLARQSFVVAVYQENDSVASAAAAEYVKHQANLIRCVKLFSKTIEQRSFPTPFHKIGAKLDLYEPEIPDNWLDAIVYKPGMFHHTRLSALPVDVRVAIMNFQDQKLRIETLSGVASKINSKPSMPQNPTAKEPQTYTLGYRGLANGTSR
ncbi:MAG: hypothetical protein ACK5EO_15795 [Planctomycetota bacterium]|jgi:hypothetical protein